MAAVLSIASATPVALVNMPWAMLRGPSIQLSTLKALLAQKNISAHVFNFNLEWMQCLHDAGLGLRDYYRVEQVGGGLGEWVFAIPPFRESTPEELEEFRAHFSDEPDVFEKALQMRALVPSFIAQCVDRILASGARVVGFTTTFQQNVPSLLLAQALKARAGHITTVFGGANCDGPMGEALHESFPFLDVVVRGEAEAIVGPLFEELLRGGPVTAHPAVCARKTRGLALLKKAEPTPVMDDVPIPDHDDYFRDLEKLSFRGEMLPTWIAFESARGCWWGQKHHCTFCGLNGNSMKFRSKSAARTLEELTTLSRKYRVTHFNATDNIIDMSYFDSLLPAIVESGNDFQFFYETKANLKKSHLEAMAAAGIREIQPGIESLSTPILSLMRKGTTALQNIRLLKWALENRIEVGWNIIVGFPGEDPAEYARMAELVPLLHHLEPPHLSFLEIHRFSPYHTNPEEHAIRITGPKPFYKYVYPLAEQTLMDIAYAFTFDYVTPQDPKVYAKPFIDALIAWGARWQRSKLEFRRGPGFMEIRDLRGPTELFHQLGEVEAQIYAMLDASATAKSVRAELVKSVPSDVAVPDEAEITAFLDHLVERRLVYREDGRYLSLAIPARPSR